MDSSAVVHAGFNWAGYGLRMNPVSQLPDTLIAPSATAAPTYRVVLAIPGEGCAEEQVREVIQHKRGDLRSVCHAAPGGAAQKGTDRMHVQLGLRRIDDVLAALEGAGFGIDAVVVTPEPSPLPPPAAPRSKARSSNV